MIQYHLLRVMTQTDSWLGQTLQADYLPRGHRAKKKPSKNTFPPFHILAETFEQMPTEGAVRSGMWQISPGRHRALSLALHSWCGCLGGTSGTSGRAWPCPPTALAGASRCWSCLWEPQDLLSQGWISPFTGRFHSYCREGKFWTRLKRRNNH